MTRLKKQASPIPEFEEPDANVTYHWKDDSTAFYLMVDMTDKSALSEELVIKSLRALANSLEGDLIGPGLIDMEPQGNA